jgi:hypothetical protein
MNKVVEGRERPWRFAGPRYAMRDPPVLEDASTRREDFDGPLRSTLDVRLAQLAVIRRRLRERVRSTGSGRSERPFKPTGFVRRRHRRQRPIGSRCAILRHAGDALDENGVHLDRAVQRRRCALDERYSGRTSRRPASANLSASARGNIPHNQRTRNCGSSSSPRSAKGRASSRCPAKASAIA